MRNFILGTDWWTDCDDAVAIRLLVRAHLRREICLKGVAINACREDSVRSLDCFLRAEGCCDLPIGIDREATDFGGWGTFQARLASQHPDPTCSNARAEDAVHLYRRLLAQAEDGSVELVEIGFLQVIAALLASGSDDVSPKTGLELVREKVKHCWIMAGKWDVPHGREHNFDNNARARAGGHAVCATCPVPITFLGWEVGHDVVSGGRLSHEDILWQILRDHGSPNGRSSWDPMLALLALIGDVEQAGYRRVVGQAYVSAESGENTFVPKCDGMHGYVVKLQENEAYEHAINERIKSCD